MGVSPRTFPHPIRATSHCTAIVTTGPCSDKYPSISDRTLEYLFGLITELRKLPNEP